MGETFRHYIGEVLNLASLGEQPENHAPANQKLITELILGEGHVRRPHIIVKDLKCRGAAPRSTK